MKELWRILFIVVFVCSLTYSKRKIKLRKHRLLKQRQDVEKVEPRKGFPGDKDRNMSKVYDTVHKYSGESRKTNGLKRHYLGNLNGVEGAHYDNNHHNGLNGVATADVGVHPDAPNVGYLDAAHGIATSLNSQKLQLGGQSTPAHHPSDEGLNPLPMYHSRDSLHHDTSAASTVNAAFPIDHHTDGLLDGHLGGDSHIVNGRVTDGLAENHHIDIADQTVAASPHLDASHTSQELSADQEGAAFLQHQQGAINIVHPEGVPHVDQIHDISNEQHVNLDQQAGAFIHDDGGHPEVLDHHMGNYFHGGVELEHHLAHQEPVVISHPPIHITKNHHHESYHDVEDQG